MAEYGNMPITRRRSFREAFEPWLRSSYEAVHISKGFLGRAPVCSTGRSAWGEACFLHADGTDPSAAPVRTLPSHDTLPGSAAITENGSASVHTDEVAQNATADPEHAKAETAAFSSPGKDQLSSPGLSIVAKVQKLSPKDFH